MDFTLLYFHVMYGSWTHFNLQNGLVSQNYGVHLILLCNVPFSLIFLKNVV